MEIKHRNFKVSTGNSINLYEVRENEDSEEGPVYRWSTETEESIFRSVRT